MISGLSLDLIVTASSSEAPNLTKNRPFCKSQDSICKNTTFEVLPNDQLITAFIANHLQNNHRCPLLRSIHRHRSHHHHRRPRHRHHHHHRPRRTKTRRCVEKLHCVNVVFIQCLFRVYSVFQYLDDKWTQGIVCIIHSNNKSSITMHH